MKFKHLLFIAFITLIVSITGCSSTSKLNNESSSTEQSSTQKQETRKVTVAGVEYEVPATPQRVIAYEGYVGSAIALDVPVVGTVMREGYDYSYLGDLSGIENVGAPISVEKALALNPDLIVTYDDSNLDQLKQIAPVVYIPYGYAGSVQEEIRLLGDVFNKKEAAEEWIRSFEEEAKMAREKLAGIIPEDATFGLYETSGKTLYVYGDNFGRGGQALYNALALKAPEKIIEDVINGDQWMEISLEVLPEYAADYMFITQYMPESGSGQTIEDLVAQNPIWGTLDAVKNNQVFMNDFNVFVHFDPMAVRYQMNLIVDLLLERAEENKVKS